MYHYAQALRRASFLMVNSSWTKNHVDSIIDYSDPILDAIHLPIATAAALLSFAIRPLLPRVSLNDAPRTTPRQSTIVYPPCDTREMSTFALEGRERIVLSISQFRCAPCIYATKQMCSSVLSTDQRKTTKPSCVRWRISCASTRNTNRLLRTACGSCS